jgi:uncharacterized protein
VDLSTGLVTPIVSGMQSPHGALFIPAIPQVTIRRDDDLILQSENLNIGFVVSRVGDLSDAITVNYSVQPSASEQNVDKSFPGKVTIPAGRSSAEFSVPFRSICEDGVTESLSVTLEPGKEYNIVRPGVATVSFTDQF